ncbi:heme ABC exporter, ATP-binding protein CcmA [Stigmatella aurantiaca DW4/3-1]|uniref:Heme ABC exporter, ATP-binding protein CcmA n=2 Tax=Stigmatella aurantiaca (strain DW4/3-1) TaxID=378806 RepID=Q098A3_STIAD|nr:heme ABC exporter, ATP-binding protein CcmA [Stigmatella aurantiaca DW4/3-1]
MSLASGVRLLAHHAGHDRRRRKGAHLPSGPLRASAGPGSQGPGFAGEGCGFQLRTLPPMDAPSAATSPALALHDVSKRYGRHWALARLTYALPARRSLLLTGHNGSGKTTLLRLVATALAPTAGRVEVLGRDAVAHRDAVRQDVALLSHTSFLYEDLTAHQNLVVLARLLGLASPADAAETLLTRVGLTRRTQSPVRHFSAGMRKRLAIARLLMKTPTLALLDEPFGELDPAGIQAMEALIGELKASGTTVVLATHLIDQGLALCEERLHLQEGRAVPA